MTSDPKSDRIADGISLIKRVQEFYTPLIPDDSLPYQAAASIVADGPYHGLISDLDDRCDELMDAVAVITALRAAVLTHDPDAKRLTNGDLSV